MNKKIVLVIEVAENVDFQYVIDYLNAESLCTLEEDRKFITEWEWIY
jgi:hypothetical protein